MPVLRCGAFLKKFVRRKLLTEHDIQASDLRRCLSTLDLIGLGVGSTLGSGVYVLTGQVAKETAGPSVILSFLIAAFASAFAGLCYAEFAARVPRAGSAYVYSYVTVGEFMAFAIGWNLLLEYIIGTASVARAWSAYFDSLIDKRMETFFRDHLSMSVTGLSAYPDIFAFVITVLITSLVAFGVKESTRVNNVFVCVNLLVIIYVVICGIFKADLDNWKLSGSQLPASGAGTGGFLPFGLSGMMSGAATCFYAYVGFDCIATTGEETQNPQRSIPVSILVALVVVTVAYSSVAAIVTLMGPYYLLDSDAPLPFLFERLHWDVAKYIITVGALCALSTSLLGAMFPLPRVLYAMASDGLVFRFLGTVSDRFKTPLLGTVVSGLLAGLMAMLFDLDQLVDMMSIGTLLAYTLVAVCVLLLRYESGDSTLSKSTSSSQSSISVSDDVTTEEKRSPRCRPTKRVQCFSGDPSEKSARIVTFSLTFMCFFFAIFAAVSVFMGSQLADGEWYAIVALTVPGVLTLLCLVLISLQPQNTSTLAFKVPLVPYVPAFSCWVNIYLMLKLSAMTWVRFSVWMAIGLSIYLLYGVWQSNLNAYDNHVILSAGQHSADSSTPILDHTSHLRPSARARKASASAGSGAGRGAVEETAY